LSASRSLSPRSLITASTLQRRGCFLAQVGPPIGSPRVGPSALSHPPWFREGLGADDRPHEPTPRVHPEAVHATCPTQATGPPAPNLWQRKAIRGAGANGRAHVPTCRCPGLGKLPISWHGAGGRRTRGRVPERTGGWDQIARGERETPGNYCTRREMPSFCIRASRVVGLSPRSLAAPLSPLTRQPVSSSFLIMCSRPGPRRSGAASRTVTPRPGVG
jgi:hypothetical protein